MVKEIIVDVQYAYAGHNVGDNGVVKLKLKSKYSELANAIQTIQMLSNDIKVLAKKGVNDKPFALGIFRLKNISIEDDGEAMTTLSSATQFVEVDNLNRLVVEQKGEEVHMRFKAEVEVEDAEEGEW